ncbi:sensor histidine kinase [Streptosporangium sp. CA-115845]|uniref:sensor histidine kinase n=1 Tax=Streptosporangium sp. CA-115845 TaxID=3240071 RepID=UPI003D8E7334
MRSPKPGPGSACQDALALGEHQERLVRALLALATSERGVTRWDTLDLAHVVEGVIASRRDQAMERRVDLTEHLTPAVTAGDPRLIESLVANLIDNAIRHNHEDGQVKVTTQTSGTQTALTVTNSGPVIPDKALFAARSTQHAPPVSDPATYLPELEPCGRAQPELLHRLRGSADRLRQHRLPPDPRRGELPAYARPGDIVHISEMFRLVRGTQGTPAIPAQRKARREYENRVNTLPATAGP